MEHIFDNYTETQIKNWITEHNILFVTNSNLIPGSLYLASLKTYIDYVPIHNLYIVSGLQEPKPFYGVKVFHIMTCQMMNEQLFSKYDYVIYIDEDAFVSDFNQLMNIFYDFYKDNAYCLAGIQDGGVICHRNHSKLMVNTFVSFWNVKILRDSLDGNYKIYSNLFMEIMKGQNKSYLMFKNTIKEDNLSLYEKMNRLADENIEKVTEYRKEHFIDGEVPYCEIVRNDPDNTIEPHQTPYSFRDDEEDYNFEPYYSVEQAYILLTGKPIYYMYATDLFDKEETECDNSGLTSVILSDENKPVVVHTWFSRCYTKYPSHKIELYHTNRINSVILKYGML